jgi:Domain of unknown function (DUF1707)
VTAGPWDSMAAGAAGRGRLRASDADREQVIDALKAAFVRGQLTRDELSVRTGQALASRTYAELAVINSSIPAKPTAGPTTGPTAVQSPPDPAPARARKRVSKKVVAWAACVIIVSPALGAAFFTYYGGFLVMFLVAFIGVIVSAKPSIPRQPGPLPMNGRR